MSVWVNEIHVYRLFFLVESADHHHHIKHGLK